MTLYEMNKASYASLPELNEDGIQYGTNLIKEYIKNTNNRYYMILNHDIHYYTLYNKERATSKELAQNVVELMSKLGSIRAIELSENEQAIEFWIIDITGECNMYAFFRYDGGVITL